MIKKWLVATVGAAALGLSAGAFAQMSQPAASGFYIGADVGQTDTEIGDDTGFKLYGGYQFHPNIAAELGYGMLFDKESVELTSIELVAVGMYPLANQLSLIGKLGFANLEAEGPGGSADETELTWGIGLQYDFMRNLGARLQWQRYETDDAIDFLSIGVIWKF